MPIDFVRLRNLLLKNLFRVCYLIEEQRRDDVDFCHVKQTIATRLFEYEEVPRQFVFFFLEKGTRVFFSISLRFDFELTASSPFGSALLFVGHVSWNRSHSRICFGFVYLRHSPSRENILLVS